MQLTIRVLRERLSVCRLPVGAELPDWAEGGSFVSISWTCEETSVVCEESTVPSGTASEDGWRALMVVGPLDFGLTGILVAIARPLSEAEVSILAVSTFDTDYVLVKESKLSEAIQALKAEGHLVDRG